MQFITTDQRIAVENFEVGIIYTVTFSNGDSFTGACIGIGSDFVAFQRTAPKLLFCLTMTTAADVASIEPLSADIGQILEYTGTVPVSIKTNGSPLLDYLITGKTVQNGTPTPDNPIMLQGTGERTAQLYFKKIANVTINADGSITSNNSFDCYLAKVETNKQYIGTGYVYSFFVNEPYIGSGASYDSQRVVAAVSYGFTSPIDGYVAVRHTAGATDAMLNSGGTALPYQPYGYKIPISSADTTTPIYLGEVETERKIQKLVLDGTETITEESTNVYSIPITDTVTTGTGLSTHFEYDSTVSAGQFRIEAGKAVFGYNDTLTNFSTFLAAQYAAGTPVTVWYVLATEETGIVNEPLMRIGDYADTLSYRQSGVNISTTYGLNIFDIDTTIKPSEVYLKYFSPLF